MDNLFELLKGVVSEDIVRKLSDVVGESAESTQQVVDAGIPAILGGILQKASDPDARGQLAHQLEENDEGLLDKLDELLGDSGADLRAEEQQRGSGLLEGILGENFSSVLELISGKAGMSSGQVGTLLATLAPIVMSFLNRYGRSQGLDLDGLLNVVLGQKDLLGNLLPEGMGDLVGLGADSASNFVDQGLAAAQTVRETAQQTIRDTAAGVNDVASSVSGSAQQIGQGNKSLFGKSLPILVVIAGALAVAKFVQVRNAEQPKPRPMVEEVLPADTSLLPAGDDVKPAGEAAAEANETAAENQ